MLAQKSHCISLLSICRPDIPALSVCLLATMYHMMHRGFSISRIGGMFPCPDTEAASLSKLP